MTTNSKGNGFAIALQNHFPDLHGSRRKFIEKVIPAIVKASSVTLRRIASAVESSAEVDSIVRRLQRLLAAESFDQAQVAKFIVSFLGIEGPMTIAIDRTNWKFGKTPVNIFMLSVKWRSKAVPLFWTLLDKAGNSNQAERIDLLEMFLTTFGPDSIANLTADREFIGQEWVGWLLNNEVAFDIRIKSNTTVQYQGQSCAAKDLFKGVKKGKIKSLKKPFTIFGCDVYLTGGPAKNKKGEDDYFIIASHRYRRGVSKRYALRWRIEQLFKELKTSGFRLKNTHLTIHQRLSNLLTLLTIAFCWILKVGRYVVQRKPKLVKKCKHGRPRYSIFRIGLDEMRKVFWSHKKRDINRVLNLLSCT